MEYLVEEVCPADELAKAEKLYNEQANRGQPSIEAQFSYALCLIRSRGEHINKGMAMMKDLLTTDEDNLAKRDYLYYIAVANLKLKSYDDAIRYVDALLRAEPTNNQAIELKGFVEKKQKRDALMGAGILGGAALAGGAILVGAIVAAATRKS